MTGHRTNSVRMNRITQNQYNIIHTTRKYTLSLLHVVTMRV